MATIKKWLDEAGFNWSDGRILWQDVEEGRSPGWGDPTTAQWIQPDHEVLTREFSSGYGGPECPRFVAEDDKAIYFPSQYDGATGIEVVFKDLTKYLDVKNETPYPGG